MRKNLQGFNSLRFSVGRLIIFVLLISLILHSLRPAPVSSQSFPTTANFTYFFPLIRTGEPTPVGPVGGTFTSFAIDPGQNDNIYAGHYGSGVYKSFDQGTTWYRKSVGLGILKIQSLATHPTSSAIVFAGTYEGGIYRSNNAGESWQASNGGVLNNHIIYDIEIDPSNPQRMFVVSRIKYSDDDPNNLRGYLARSVDGGLNWTILLTGDSFSSLDYFYDVDIDPANSNIIYLTAHQHGFYKSVDGGVNFYAINTGVSDLSARSFAIDSAHSGLVYGGVWHGGGVYKTWNSGVSWFMSSSGLPADVEVFRVILDPFGGSQKRVFSCTYGDGLYSSDNLAENWVSRGLAGQRLYDFVIADGNPQRWYAATENNGLFRSSSFGSNWNSIMADLRLTDITGLTELPGDPEALAGAVYGQGVFRITDTGDNWARMNEGLTNLDVVSLAVTDDQLYALGRGWMSVWDGDAWQDLMLPEADPEAVDGGINWVRERVLLPDEAFELDAARSVQPTSLAWQDGKLLLGTAGSGLWLLEGNEWEQVGLKNLVIEKLVPTSEGNVDVFVCTRNDDCYVYQLDPDGLSQKEDSEEAVDISAIGLTRLPTGLDKSNQGSLVLATSKSDNCLWAVGEQTRVWITKDCGENWVARSFDWTVQALVFDPLDANVLLVGTRESGAFRLQVP